MDHDKKAIQPRITRTAPKPLTAAAIAGMKPGKTLGDGAVRPGSGSLKVRKRVTVGGVVVEWLFEFRSAGKAGRMTIGRYNQAPADGYLTLSQARGRAAELQRMVRAGQSPLDARELERKQTRIAQAAAVALAREAEDKTLAALLATYVQGLRSRGKDRSAYDAENLFNNHVVRPFPELAALPVEAIKPEHVTRVLARLVGPEVGEKKGRTAIKLRAYMGAAFALAKGASKDPMAPAAAADFGLNINPVTAVPVRSMAAKFNRAGNRVLSVDELRAYWMHVAALPSTMIRAALTLQLAAGGQRFRQLLRLTAEDVTGDSLVLFDPKGKRNEPRRHELPIVAEMGEVLDMLGTLRAGDSGGALFSVGDVPMSPLTLSKAVSDISAAMVAGGLSTASFRGGDIRRTVETMLGQRLKVSRDDRAQLLSHGLSGVQERNYDKGEYLDAKHAALRTWNDFLADLCIGPVRTGTVLAFTRAA